jgi:hypothetical protein
MSHRPPFTLVTDEERIPITNGHYALVRTSAVCELGRVRCVGFVPGDAVLVIGTSGNGGVVAGQVFGGTRAEFGRTLEDQQALIPAGRALGWILLGGGLLLLARWAGLGIQRRLRGRRGAWVRGLGILFHGVGRRVTSG